MQATLLVMQITAAIVLVVIVLLQGKGGGLGGIMGSDSSMFRTRRGLERILFRFTIGWGIFFVVLSMVTAAIIAAPTTG